MGDQNTFSQKLIDWYTVRKRDLPWRDTTEAYPVWLSEIILQQTRVAQGLPYWRRFMQHFPTVGDLAKADEDQVMRLWQGLGYYSRARNLHATAKHIAFELDGAFPDTYDGILKLKGIGPYTAAAIASFCFGEAKPVIDGNVYRFAARYFGLSDDISRPGSRRVFEKALNKVIPHSNPGIFNQAIMEFGATQCSPKPDCNSCPFQGSCFAYAHNAQTDLPVKTGKTKVRNRYFHYVVMQQGDHFLMKKREASDVWNGLYEFFLIEGEADRDQIMQESAKMIAPYNFEIKDISEEVIHLLSHQRIHAVFYHLVSPPTGQTQMNQLQSYSVQEMLNLPKPKLIVNYLQRLGIS